MDKKNPTGIRSGLRLILSNPPVKESDNNIPDEAQAATGSESTSKVVQKNPLVSFMSAYADAIDRDVEMILGL